MYRVARRVEQALGQAPLEEVWFAFERLQCESPRLQGQRLKGVRTLGKALLIEFEGGETIYTHNQLYGRWMFSDPDRRPDTGRQLRLALSTEKCSALLYSASEIELIEPGELEAHPFIRRVGLDVLSDEADVDAIERWIGRPEFAGRRLGHLLLDQRFLAGVGNYLRSEILHQAGLDWRLRPVDLDPVQRQALASSVYGLMWRSVDTGGITNAPERVAELKRAGWKRRDYRHFVFSRAGQACFLCGGEIEKLTVSGRRLYRCAQCQPEPSS
ncbi:Endonuclease VIII (Dna glycosylase/ap lyase nei) (Dna-(Apurinic or apyrimidinic site) lyase nei) [Wenzhouxiangella marina]|uniref:DNA-(apurinic or apyrimidinic site) lyase n=2 Tax=Wenzhouxiangella marina TaxID=1579979 RepID=A0A0K0XVC0_9GAMM|nr:Endonuclease VIII (Dna glycosylase/ap lyase nei) (Dna-(Apurinic or apyrimidinic site) lyase nei) [Wenzhouxiangella marina]